MIEPDSVNVLDLEILRRTDSGIGGDGVGADASVSSGLSAHHEEQEKATRDAQGREIIITDSLWISGVDALGVLVDVKAHDFARWTDFRGTQTDPIEIQTVSPFYEPGKGTSVAGLAHVRLDVGR